VHALVEDVVGLGHGAVVEEVGGGDAELLHVGQDLLGAVHDDWQNLDAGLGESGVLLDLGHLHGAGGAAGAFVEVDEHRAGS